jgi:hypothetical protein
MFTAAGFVLGCVITANDYDLLISKYTQAVSKLVKISNQNIQHCFKFDLKKCREDLAQTDDDLLKCIEHNHLN